MILKDSPAFAAAYCRLPTQSSLAARHSAILIMLIIVLVVPPSGPEQQAVRL
jgi:hypothetical protein